MTPKVHIWKAISGESAKIDVESEARPSKNADDILGWVLFKTHEAEGKAAPPKARTTKTPEEPHKRTPEIKPNSIQENSSRPSNGSRPFLEKISGEFKAAVAEHSGTKPHIHCNFLMVRPEQQGKGIGSAIL